MPKLKPPASRVRQVRFEVRLPGADEVAITGDFCGWRSEGIPLHHAGEEIWYANLELPPGEHQYRLLVDGCWRDDPAASRRVANPFGTENAVLVVK